MSDYIVATLCACHRPATHRFRVTVGGSEVWIVVCDYCLEMERRDVQHGQDPPLLERLTPRFNRRRASVTWRKVRAALSFHGMTRRELARATGLSEWTVRDCLTAHNNRDVYYYRRNRTAVWELCEGREELPY